MAGERTQEATPHRRQKARQSGDRVHSRELISASGTLAGVMTLGAVSAGWMRNWAGSLGRFLDLGLPAHWEPAATETTLLALRRLMVGLLAPAGLVSAAVALAALLVGLLQNGGLEVHPNLVALKLERLNPWTNLQGLFSLRAGARLGKSLIPAGILALLAVQRIEGQMRLPPFSALRLEMLGGDVYALLLSAAWLLFGWSAVDYLVEWRSWEQRLKMSREELREEFKQTEGNPQIRGRIRGLQRQLRRRRVKADVAKAAVVITNPTHYAVALGFDFETMDAPKVLAKGRNLRAEEIKAEARWAGVPILENPPLARSLYRSVEPGQSIPVDLYAAVAAILAYLYRRRVEEELAVRRRQAQGAQAARPGTGPGSGPAPRAGQAAKPTAAGGTASSTSSSTASRTSSRTSSTPDIRSRTPEVGGPSGLPPLPPGS